MSNSLAIAAVTATLRNRLIDGFSDLPGTAITTKPLDQARNGTEKPNQINLLLYQTEPNLAWRNMDTPGRVKPGETARPALALNLNYLITAYGEGDDAAEGHRLLGRAMSLLHDHAVLDPAEIESALPDSDLNEQVERVRITPLPLSVDEISKLWAAFQTEYRVSAAYHVSVVLIDSLSPVRTPLPVLTRGPADSGVVAQADLTPPFPTLTAITPPGNQPAARLGDTLSISGHHLEGDSLVARFRHPRLASPIEVTPGGGATATAVEVQIPNDPASWPVGFYALAIVVRRAGEEDRTTNELPFALAPRIVTIAPDPAVRDGAGDVTLTLTVAPEVHPEQLAALLLGAREVLAQPHPAQTATLTFQVTDANAGDHLVRARVDGVDSLLIDRSVEPPVFDPSQKVTIT